MKEAVLKERLEDLGWTTYRLAKELSTLRGKGSASSYTSAVTRAIVNPNTASLRTFEELVTLLGGEVLVRWPQTETVVTGYEEIS